MGAFGVMVLVQLLPSQTELSSLALCNNGIGCEGAACLASVLEELPSLTRLDLTNNQILARGFEALIHALPLTQIKCLNLSNTGNVSYEVFGGASMNLPEPKKSAPGFLALAEALPRTKLTELLVEGIDLGSEATFQPLLEATNARGIRFARS
jgi:Leucine-rich repeat (LRR) protein